MNAHESDNITHDLNFDLGGLLENGLVFGVEMTEASWIIGLGISLLYERVEKKWSTSGTYHPKQPLSAFGGTSFEVSRDFASLLHG